MRAQSRTSGSLHPSDSSGNCVTSSSSTPAACWRVIFNKEEITIKDIEKEADAVQVMDYLKKLTGNKN